MSVVGIEPRLCAHHVDFSYGSRRVLTEISLDVYPGEYLSLIGPNGSGKTTLFKLLCGFEKPMGGDVRLYGEAVRGLDVRYRAQHMAAVYQSAEPAMPFTCLESILLGLHPHRGRFQRISRAQYDRVRELMEMTDTWRLSGQPVTQISGGERQRVALCRALAQEPGVLLLDEAMSEMDVAARMRMSGLLKRLCADTGLAVLAIHHDLGLAYRFSDRIYALKEGRCAGAGEPGAVMTEEFFGRVFEVKAEIFPNKGFFIQNPL
jgi:iron complex transport system ATP-binding protein